RTHAVLGSAPYMSPEQARGEGATVGEASDVYGLGAILYECLTGHPPFDGADVGAIRAQVLTRPPRPPREHNRGGPRVLEGLCLRCLAKSPNDRPFSARAVADELETWLRGEHPDDAQSPRPPRHRARTAILAGVALLTLAVSVVTLAAPAPPWSSLQPPDTGSAPPDPNAPLVLLGEKGSPRSSRWSPPDGS